MRWKIHVGKDIKELNPGLNGVPEYEKCTSRQLLFVAFVADPSHDNPVGTLTGRNRRDAAARLSGYRLEGDGRLDKNGRDAVLGKVKTIENAIETFIKLNYNEREVSIEAMKRQIHEIQELVNMEKKKPILDDEGNHKINDHGELMYEWDFKLLDMATKYSDRLPDLHANLEKLIRQNRAEQIIEKPDEEEEYLGEVYVPETAEYLESEEEDEIPMIELKSERKKYGRE